MRIDDKYKWLARDKYGELYAYEKKPFKSNSVGWDVKDGDYDDVEETDDTYSFVQWEDEEPFAININAELPKPDKLKAVLASLKNYQDKYVESKKEIKSLKEELASLKIQPTEPNPINWWDNAETFSYTSYEPLQSNVITKPSHYIGINGLEMEEVLENFLPKIEDSYVAHRLGSAVEYLLRSSEKNGIQDIKKAKRNLEQVIAYEESKIKPEEVVEEPESVKQPTDDHLTEFLAFLRGIKVTEDKNMEKVSTFYHGYNLND